MDETDGSADNVFMTKKVTNYDIYQKLINVEHQVIKTNGTVGWHTKAIGALFVLICGIISILGGRI